MNRRQFLRLGATAAAAGLGVGGYTWQVEPHWVEVVERELPIDKLPPALAGARMVQISDLHVGPRVSDEYLIDCLRRVSDLRPDVRPEITSFTLGSQTGASLFGEIQARWGAQLRHTIDPRSAASTLRRWAAEGRLDVVHKGRAYHEGQYTKPR